MTAKTKLRLFLWACLFYGLLLAIGYFGAAFYSDWNSARNTATIAMWFLSYLAARGTK